jgi:hypothetical protein
MTARDLFTLALRVIGFWELISAVESTAFTVAMFSAGGNSRIGLVVELGITAFARAAAAAALMLCAPAVAGRFYRKEHGTLLAMDSREVYRIAARILGLFSFIAAIYPASSIATGLIVPDYWDWSAESWQWAYIVQSTLYLACGVMLAIGASKIAALFASSHALSSSHMQPRDPRAATSTLSPRDAFQIAAMALGLFCFFSAIRPISNIATVLLARVYSDLVNYSVEPVLYIACGVILLFGARKFAVLFISSRASDDGLDIGHTA